jgi:hypothetical protein
MPPLVPSLTPALAAFGVPATIMPLDGAPVVTTIIFLRPSSPPTIGNLGMSAGAAVDLRDVVSVPRAMVPSLPIGSTLMAAKGAEAAIEWVVDRVDDLRPDEFRAVVSPAAVP